MQSRTHLQVGNRVSLLRVNKAGEKYGILDEEDRGIVAHQVPDTIFGVEFNSKTTGIPKKYKTKD